MKWILGVNLEKEIHSYHLKCMLVTKRLLNYSKIVILLILNSNESLSSLVEMSGVSWSKRNVIKFTSVIKTPCNQGQQNTELPSDVLRLIFFFVSHKLMPAFHHLPLYHLHLLFWAPCIFFSIISSTGTARKNSICTTAIWV